MRRPRGHGRWAFQRTARRRAFDDDLFGDVVFVDGTFSDAKRVVIARGEPGLWAVLP